MELTSLKIDKRYSVSYNVLEGTEMLIYDILDEKTHPKSTLLSIIGPPGFPISF